MKILAIDYILQGYHDWLTSCRLIKYCSNSYRQIQSWSRHIIPSIVELEKQIVVGSILQNVNKHHTGMFPTF